MSEFTVRSESVDVEQIMEQIRDRIREKRGVDYTEEQIRELAAVKLEKFLDPRGLRSDLLDQFRRVQKEQAPPAPPNFAFEDETLYESHRAPLRWIRRLLQPVLKLFFNPNPLIQALHIQSQLNRLNAERETARRGLDALHYEMLHNLVVETTRLGIEVKNLKMRVESLTSRLEFNERRARALESVVVYRPSPGDQIVEGARSQPPPAIPGAGPGPTASPPGPGQRSRRRRRRRGRRGEAPASAVMASGAGPRDAVVRGESDDRGGDEHTGDREERSGNAGQAADSSQGEQEAAGGTRDSGFEPQ